MDSYTPHLVDVVAALFAQAAHEHVIRLYSEGCGRGACVKGMKGMKGMKGPRAWLLLTGTLPTRPAAMHVHTGHTKCHHESVHVPTRAQSEYADPGYRTPSIRTAAGQEGYRVVRRAGSLE